jgi:hypothetical protein
MEDLKKITDHLEYLFLIKIANGLKGKQVDIPTSKSLAQEFLKIEPFQTLEDARSKIDKFASLHPLLTNLKEYIDGYYFEHHKDEMLEQMKAHMKAGNIDEALRVVKG